KQAPEKFMYWELPRYDSKTAEFRAEVPMQAARMGDWKAVRPEPNGELELYNLRSDPNETTDVSKQHAEVLAQLTGYLQSARVPPRPQKDPPQDFVRPGGSSPSA
ncbi:MAG TPA: hypothetical protein VES20_10720, partial [Bryobacteraceae bacterium]|nr:hypothetical protein [Bryobacteraceae bacterium]